MLFYLFEITKFFSFFRLYFFQKFILSLQMCCAHYNAHKFIYLFTNRAKFLKQISKKRSQEVNVFYKSKVFEISD